MAPRSTACPGSRAGRRARVRRRGSPDRCRGRRAHGSRARVRCRCPRARRRAEPSARGRSTRCRWRRGRSPRSSPVDTFTGWARGRRRRSPWCRRRRRVSVSSAEWSAPRPRPGTPRPPSCRAASGTTSTTMAATATTVRTRASAHRVADQHAGRSRTRAAASRRAAPRSRRGHACCARADVNAFGCTTSMTSIPPNSTTCGIASRSHRRTTTFTESMCRSRLGRRTRVTA